MKMKLPNLVDFSLSLLLMNTIFTFLELKMLELQLDLNNDKFQRVNTIEDAQNKIKEYQHYGLTKFYISNKFCLF